MSIRDNTLGSMKGFFIGQVLDVSYIELLGVSAHKYKNHDETEESGLVATFNNSSY